MDNNEILNELAQAMGNIIENKVAEKTKELEEKPSINADAIVEAIENGAFDTDALTKIVKAINFIEPAATEDLREQAVEDAKEDGKVIGSDDIDEDYIFDKLPDYMIRDIAKRYIDENL